MRKLGYLLMLVVALLAVSLLAPWQWIDISAETINKLRGQSATDNSYSGKTYVLPTENFLQFPLPGIARGLRLSSNAAILQQQAGNASKVHYAIHYQLIDDNDQVLLEDTYHHRSFLPTPLVTDDKQPRYPLFFIDPSLIPTLPQPQVISSPLLTQAAYLRLRLASKDDNIVDVAVRVAYQQAASQTVSSYQWQRLSQDKKEELAKAHIYGVKQLTHHEKEHLLRSESKPIGPDGNEGEEYISRKLYRMNRNQRAIYADISEPEGRYIDSRRLGTVTIKAKSAIADITSKQHIAITFKSNKPQKPTEIQLRWQSTDGKDNRVFTFHRTNDNTVWSASLPPGLLEISSQNPLYFTAKQSDAIDSQADNDLLDDLKYIRGWQFSDTALTYSVYSANKNAKQADAIRIDIRQIPALVLSPTNHSDNRIVYRWIDDQGNILQNGELQHNDDISRYDWLVKTQTAVTEPAQFYLSVPVNARQLRLEGARHQVISIYVRPFGMIKQVTLPNPAIFSHDPLPIQPHWFLTRPDHWQRLMLDDRSHRIAIQTRPKTLDESILAGQFEWVEAKPINAYGRDILVPKTGNNPFRQQAIASTFYALNHPVSSSLIFNSADARTQFNASLIYDRDDKRPINISLTIDGHRQDIESMSYQGEIPLKALTPGKHQLSINAPDSIRWYLNYVTDTSMAEALSYQRRHVYRLDNTALVIPFVKKTHEKEVLLVQFFPDAPPVNQPIALNDNDSKLVAVLRSQIQRQQTPQKLSMGHTLLTRDFTLLDTPMNAEEVDLHRRTWPIFGAQGARVGNGKRLYIPLDADLPPGTYPITLSLLKGRQGYITAYSLVPGEYQRQRFFTEDPQA